jgi:hypothetical protein
VAMSTVISAGSLAWSQISWCISVTPSGPSGPAGGPAFVLRRRGCAGHDGPQAQSTLRNISNVVLPFLAPVRSLLEPRQEGGTIAAG